MIDLVSAIDTRVQEMRRALVEKGSVASDGYTVTRIEAKKKVLGVLDNLAASIAGSHRRMSNIECDYVYSENEKIQIRREVIDEVCTAFAFPEDLIEHLGMKSDAVCQDLLMEDANEAHGCKPLINGQTRKDLVEKLTILEESRSQLLLLHRVVDGMVTELNSHMT